MVPDVQDSIGGLARRQLHLFYLLDISASMASGGKLAALNDAMRSVLPMLKEEVGKPDRQHVEMVLRVIVFSTGARWHIQTPTTIADCQEWTPLEAQGTTDMGQAFELLAGALNTTMPRRCLPPCVVLISDGQATDDVEGGMEKLRQVEWFEKLVRVGIAMGDDADQDMLANFTGNMELVLPAHNRDQFIRMLRWASTSITTASSTGVMGPGEARPTLTPPPPEILQDDNTEDHDDSVVW